MKFTEHQTPRLASGSLLLNKNQVVTLLQLLAFPFLKFYGGCPPACRGGSFGDRAAAAPGQGCGDRTDIE